MKILNQQIIGVLIYFGQEKVRNRDLSQRNKKGFKKNEIIYKMGIKSSQRNNTLYKVGGLIFPNKDRYVEFEGIDDGADILISHLRNEDNIKEFFDRINPIEVIETYPDAREEMDGLFSNITRYLL